MANRGHWKGTPVAIKKWFDPNMSDELMQEFRCAEPDHQNLAIFSHVLFMPFKYPHIGLMKLTTYHALLVDTISHAFYRSRSVTGRRS